jgi:predicted RNA-binding Zn ribbon-like protein
VVSATPNVNYVVSGVLLPLPLAGAPALELCNTFAGWGEDAGREYLLSYEHLVVWSRERGFVDTAAAAGLARGGDAPEAARVLERARRLRSAFYAVATGEASDDDRAAVAREAERAAAASRLAWHDGAAAWTLPASVELPVLAVARALGDFVTRPGPVGRCPGRACGWLFADPRGRRRWCSMATCGNRAKVRKHAARRRAR